MYNKRSTLLLTEILLLLLISQLFWPVQQYTDNTLTIALVTYLLFFASWIALLVLPGWWWSYLFFDDEQIGGFERFIVSLAISLALVVFSSAYLKSGGIALYPRTVLVILVCRIALGVGIVFGRAKKSSAYEEEIYE